MVMVKEMMNKSVVSVTPETTLTKICQLLTRYKISGVPVVGKKKELLGFVSERDIIAAVPKQNFFKKTAKDIMIKGLTTVEDTTSLNEVSLIFSNEPFRHLPVMKKGKLVGMISRKDIINQMLGHYY
jgi:CBS domain-containing protein